MSLLPARFADLRPFLDEWALATEDARSRKRWRSSAEEFQAFYDAVLPRLDDILKHLEGCRPGSLPAEDVPLYRLALAFAEAAPHVELYGGSAEVPNSFEASRFAATHGDIPDQ